MALDVALYLVTKDIAVRSGLIATRYRIADGRFVLDNKDLSRVRFTTDEYISGLQGVTKVSEEEAKTLIAENGYQMGEEPETPVATQEKADNDNTETENEENVDGDGESEKTQEEITGEDVGSVEDVLGGLINKNNNQENTEE